LSRIAQKRARRPARSPASTQCLDILCPPPGISEVISHFERLSSNEMKMAPICVWIAAGSSCGSSDIGSLQSESDRNLSLPHDRPLSTPHGIFASLAMTDGELAHMFLRVALMGLANNESPGEISGPFRAHTALLSSI